MRRLAVLLLLVSTPVLAQTPPRAEGEYGGVNPSVASGESGAQPTRTKKRAPAGTLTWLGFEAQDGGARVFFQSVAPFEITQRLEGGTLVVHLGLSRLATNTSRPVDTRFFDNPLARIAAKRVRAGRAGQRRAGHATGIEVRIAFKTAADAREGEVRSETGPDGMHYVYLAFPPGTAAAPQPTLDDPER